MREVSLTCSPGRVFSLLGPNGAGKTTILRTMATLLSPTSGSVRVAGYDVSGEPREVRSRIGFLTGTTRLCDRLTAEELVLFYADLHGMERGRFRERMDEVFGLLGMEEFSDRLIGKLSSGMRQKVSIARTIIHDPEVVVFDEPTSGLDVISSRGIRELVSRSRDAGRTVVFSTHIMSEVSLLSDDVGILHRGRLLFLGTMEELRGRTGGLSLEEGFIRILEEGEVTS